MSNIVKQLSDVYHPYAAIIAYKTDDEQSERSYYLEEREIRKGKMGVGKPLTSNMLASIISKVQHSAKQLDTGLCGAVPHNVLYCDTRVGRDKLVWYNGPEEHYVYFSKSLNIPNGKMKVPGLLYVVNNNRLSLYAFKGKKPTKDLYMAPFMNTSTEYVCLGNAKIKKPTERTFSNVIAYWENMFWKSEFSHILGKNPVKSNLAVLSKHLIESGEAFPTKELVPICQKLNDLLK